VKEGGRWKEKGETTFLGPETDHTRERRARGGGRAPSRRKRPRGRKDSGGARFFEVVLRAPNHSTIEWGYPPILISHCSLEKSIVLSGSANPALPQKKEVYLEWRGGRRGRLTHAGGLPRS